MLEQAQMDALINFWENGDQPYPLIGGRCLTGHSLPDTDDLKTFWMNTDFVIERAMAIVDESTYYGIAVPNHYIDVGSNSGAGVLGAKIKYIDKETIWAHPHLTTIKEVFDVVLQREQPYYQTILSHTRSSTGKSAGHHYVSCYAHCGVLDNLSGICGPEKLLVAMIEEPDLVLQALEHLTTIWWDSFEEQYQIIDQAGNYGSMSWPGVWTPHPHTYALQEDVSYMISPDMFERFCLPFIREASQRLGGGFYHLDGVPAIRHLDHLLDLDDIKVIQWIPGAGKWDLNLWYDLIRKIVDAGKSCQLFARAEEVAPLVEAVGSDRLLLLISDPTPENMEALCRRYPLA